MSTVVVIHQPDFIPYIGFFQRFLNSDLFIVQDAVLFSKRGWTHRDKIKTAKGASWMTLPLQKYSQFTPINDIFLSDSYNWQSSHLKLIKLNYEKAPYYQEIFPLIRPLYEIPSSDVVSICFIHNDEAIWPRFANCICKPIESLWQK